MEKIKVTDKKESPETGDKTVSIISIADLQERVRMGESLPQDDSFFDAEKGSSLGYFNREEITGLTGLLSGDEKSYPIVEIDGKIVGLA